MKIITARPSAQAQLGRPDPAAPTFDICAANGQKETPHTVTYGQKEEPVVPIVSKGEKVIFVE